MRLLPILICFSSWPTIFLSSCIFVSRPCPPTSLVHVPCFAMMLSATAHQPRALTLSSPFSTSSGITNTRPRFSDLTRVDHLLCPRYARGRARLILSYTRNPRSHQRTRDGSQRNAKISQGVANCYQSVTPRTRRQMLLSCTVTLASILV